MNYLILWEGFIVTSCVVALMWMALVMMFSYEAGRKIIYKLTVCFIKCPIPMDHGRWQVYALVLGIIPMKIRSSKSPWPNYSEEHASETIRLIKEQPSKYFRAEDYD